jgi:predicted RNase H-like nuclease (RuvC/YqgF family)
MDDDALERQVTQQARELADLKRQVEHERETRGFLQDRLDRLERSLHGKIGRAEAVAMLWIAIPIVFAVVTIIAVALVMSKPHP